MMRVQYFLAIYNDDDHTWTIGDEPFFPASAGFEVAKRYRRVGLKVEVVEQLTRTVARFEEDPEPLKAA